MRILLIEDDVELCRSLSLLLEQQHFSVTSCHDGEEGLFYILENGHDLVLLDRMLPGLDGLEVLRQARAAHCTTPILFLTALGSLKSPLNWWIRFTPPTSRPVAIKNLRWLIPKLWLTSICFLPATPL